MLIYNELPLPFPWYDKLEMQNRFRENCGANCDFRLITPRSNLLPFEFRRPQSGALLSKWTINFIDGAIALDLTRNTSLINAKTLEGYDYFWYNGEAMSVELEPGNIAGLNLPPGEYYSVITAVNETYYSEVFFVPDKTFSSVETDNIPYLTLEWNNDTDVKPILYNTASGFKAAYKNVLYLDTIITGGEPVIVEETVEDGEGTQHPVFQKMTISYKIQVLAPDFIKLALAAIQLHKNVTVITPNGIRIGDASNFAITSQPESDGCLSTIDITIQQDLAYINHECGANMQIAPCAGTAPVLTSVITQTSGLLAMLGTAASDTWLEVYAAATETGTYFKIKSGVQAVDFIAGTAYLSAAEATGYNWFKVVSLNYNCNYGQSSAVLKI